PPTEQVLPLILDDLSEPIILIEEEPPTPVRPTPTPPPLPARVTGRHSASAAAASADATGPAGVPGAPASRGNTGAATRRETAAVPDDFRSAGKTPQGIDTTLKTAVPAFEL